MRLTEKQKAEVITDYTAGKSQSEIARKFNVSVTAISKILNNFKSLNNNPKVKKSLTESLNKRDNKEIARDIYYKAMESLQERVNKATASELLKIIEYYNILYNFSEENNNDKVEAISITIENGGEDDTED